MQWLTLMNSLSNAEVYKLVEKFPSLLVKPSFLTNVSWSKDCKRVFTKQRQKLQSEVIKITGHSKSQSQIFRLPHLYFGHPASFTQLIKIKMALSNLFKIIKSQKKNTSRLQKLQSAAMFPSAQIAMSRVSPVEFRAHLANAEIPPLR